MKAKVAKRNLVAAAVGVAMLALAGCASQNCPAPMAATCKGMSSCKGMVHSCKGKAKKMHQAQ